MWRCDSMLAFLNSPWAGLLSFFSSVASNAMRAAAQPSFSVLRRPSTRHGPASSTVTAEVVPSVLKSWVIPSFLARRPFMSALDLDADAGRKAETLEGVDHARVEVEDVDHALVRAHLELLA